MGVTTALIIFVIFIIVYITISEVFTVLFRLTGLNEEKARFQVISMLTNSGYTTEESELITSSKIRRRLARSTMIFGYSFTVTMVSTVVNFFLSLINRQEETLWMVAVIIVLTFALLYALKRIRWVKKTFDNAIERAGNRIMFGKSSNPVVMLDTYGQMSMAEVRLTHLPEILVGTPLSKTNLREEYDLQILLVKRNGKMLDKVTGDTIIKKDDVIVIFGLNKSIRAYFENPLSVTSTL